MKRYINLILCVISFLLFSPDLQAKEGKPHLTIIEGKRGKHRFVARFVTGDFRKIYHKATGSGIKARINGKPEWNRDGSKNWKGTDGGLPHQEFYSFQITVDGRKWTVPKRLWQDCYDPNLRATKPKTIWATLSLDGNKLAMRMYGSDGAGAYYVIWYLRADGRHRREFRSTEEAWKWSR